MVCLATARGKGRRFSRTGRAIHILQPPYPSFGHSREGGGRGREGGRESRRGGREGLRVEIRRDVKESVRERERERD